MGVDDELDFWKAGRREVVARLTGRLDNSGVDPTGEAGMAAIESATESFGPRKGI
jgi:hypothetical protein